MKNIIINADDFGMNEYVNDAIIKGHVNGIITSTSMVAAGDNYDDAVKYAKECPNLGIGIHCTLVGGLSPLIKEANTLVNEDGVFYDSHTEFIKRAYLGKIDFNQVYNELDMQFEKILGSGLNVTHVDGHQHLHVLPNVLPIVFSLMKKYKINKMRIPKEQYTFLNDNYHMGRIVGKVGLSYLSEKARSKANSLFIRTPRYFWGMMNGGNLTETNLLKIIKKAKRYEGCHELMVHPGTSNSELNAKYHWNYHWEEELNAMTSEKVKEALKKAKFNLINYGDIK